MQSCAILECNARKDLNAVGGGVIMGSGSLIGVRLEGSLGTTNREPSVRGVVASAEVYSAFQNGFVPRNVHRTEEYPKFEICMFRMRRMEKNDITDGGLANGAQIKFSESSYPRFLTVPEEWYI